MEKWTTTADATSMSLLLNGQPVLSGITAAVVKPGKKPSLFPPGKPTVAGVPFGRDLFVSAVPSENDAGVLMLRCRYCGSPVDAQGGVQVRIAEWNGFERAMASNRYSPYWARPNWLDEPAGMPDRTQFLLVRRAAGKGKYLVMLPLVSGGIRGELRAVDGQAAIVGVSCDSHYTPCGFVLAAIAVGDDPYALIDRVFAAAMAAGATGRLRKDKPVPPFAELFGWCSWNAFYSNVTEEDVIKALQSFRAGKMPVGFYILDDGWQSGGQYETHPAGREPGKAWGLKAFGANEKFPHGLASLIRRVKQETDLEYFGVWHTLQGTWDGIHPDGEIAGDYRTFRDGADRNICQPDDAYRFFNDYHAYLRAQGVDFVKVDNQSSLEGNIADRYPVGEAARLFHQALDGSVAVHFGGQIINCMSMSSDIMQQLPLTNVARNSDDFYPHRPNNPGQHVTYNAYNNLWTAQLSIPDWDMFESHHPYGEFHAMARAVSGSPIYCTDFPGKQNFDLLRKLATSDGRALRCEDPAQVTRDCLMADPRNEPVLLKIFNALPTGHGLLGVFNCRATEGVKETKGKYTTFSDAQRRELAATAKYSPADVEPLREASYAVYSHRDGRLGVMTRRAKAGITLNKYESDVLVFAPIELDAAVLGLIDKFNSPAAIDAWGFDGKALLVELIDGGTAGFYAKRRPRAVLVNDRPIKRFNYDKDTGLLTVKVRLGKPAMIEIKL